MDTFEKKYNEALERARAMYDVNYTDSYTKVNLETIFPELRESEDEKIMKILSDVFADSGDRFISEYERKLVVSWLKKKKEQKPCEDSGADGDIMQYIEEGKKRGIKEVISFPEKYGLQKEQKPNYCHHEVDETGWTEEYRKAYYDGWNNCNMQHEQLKADQNPAEWSKEDERMRNQLIYDVEQHKEKCLISAKQNKATKAIYDGIEKCQDEKIAWLKSLRPSWKPSEEQMNALNKAAEFFQENHYVCSPLITLYEQLKKL